MLKCMKFHSCLEISILVLLSIKNLKRTILCKTEIAQRKKQNVQKILQHYQVF